MITRNERLKRLTGALILFAIFPLAWLIHPLVSNSKTTICLFRSVTGLPCPFCGLTHAFGYAMHGNFAIAFSHHYFWWLAALIIIAVGLLLIHDAVKGSNFLGYLDRIWRLPVWLIVSILTGLILVRILLSI